MSAASDDIDAHRWRHRLAARLFGVPTPAPRIGQRYRIGERIGEGGMGVVYRAWDECLGRAVALKLVRPGLRGGSERSSRLRREARALARLCHPNVVSAFDVGVDNERVFIAMELVEGPTLRAWIAKDGREADSILGVLVGAGQGLAAAHEAGLVHRDFKPDNVLVGPDGRARVVDFGLALTVDEVATDRSSDDGDMAERLAQTHARGTPLYMPPEARRGRPCDARGDQFAFCVTARELLDGRHPYVRSDLAQTMDDMMHGRPLRPPSDSRCPTWLVPILDRGLKPRPQERWPSMRALLQAIERGRGRGRRRGLWALAVGGSTLALGFAAWRPGPECTGAPERIQQVWSTVARHELRDRLLVGDAGYARDVWPRVRGALDRFGGQWVESHRRACEAGGEAERAEADLDARMACLDAALDRFGAVVEVLGRVAEPGAHAVAAVSELPRPDRCLDTAPRAMLQPAEHQREATRQIAEDLARVEASISVGEYATALQIAEAASAAAALIDHAPTRAAAAFELGTAQEHAGQLDEAARTLEDAVWRAQSALDDELVAEASTSLVFVLGDRLARYDQAEVWIGHAFSALERAGRPELLHARLWGNVALVRQAQGRLDEALDAYEQALARTREALGADHLAVATAAHNLGMALFEQGRYERAERVYREVIDVRRRALGPRHPLVGASRLVLGPVLHRLGRYDEARHEVERALEVSEAALGPEHRQTAAARINLGVMVQQAGDVPRAVALFTEALGSLRAIHGDEHVAVADAEDGLGSALQELGRFDEALVHHQRALAIVRGLLPADSPRVAATLGNLGSLHHAVGDHARARDAFDEALEIFEQAVGQTHPFYAFAMQGRGKARWRRGEIDEGQADLERAIELERQLGREPRRLAEVLFSLAQLLWEAERDRPRAVALATEAVETLRQQPGLAPAQLARWDAWLAERRAEP